MLEKKISSTNKTTKITRCKEMVGEITEIKVLTGVSYKTTTVQPIIGEINKSRTQIITAHTTINHETSDQTSETKITTDPQIIQTIVVTGVEIIPIQLEISGQQTDPRVTIGAVKIGMTTTGTDKMEIIRYNAKITMAGTAKIGSIVGTATAKMEIIITGMEDIIQVPKIQIFNQGEVVNIIAIPEVGQTDHKWDRIIIQKTKREGVR